MPAPDFVLALREKVGKSALWLSGVTAVVVKDDEILMVRRADSGEWAPVTGIIDPGEEPSEAAVREVREEADVDAIVEHLAWVHVTEMYVYPNGDRSQYIDIVFRLRWTGGNPHPADGENLEARWFSRSDLPTLSGDMRRRVEVALDPRAEAGFGPLPGSL